LLRLFPEKYPAHTFVLVPRPNSPEIAAYYTLTPAPGVLIGIHPDDEVQTDIIWLEYLAVARPYQRRGIGKEILEQIILDVLAAADIHSSVSFLMLYSLSDRTTNWYLSLGLGFREVAPGSPYLALEVATMRQGRLHP
jgi:GNAT superfamily N-acetyltransferase